LQSKSDKLSAPLLSPVDSFYRSNREKEKGNECFRAKEYDTAMLHYTNAIAYLPIRIHLMKTECLGESKNSTTPSLFKNITGKDSINLEFFIEDLNTSACIGLLERKGFAVFFANRAMVHLKLENFATAEEDCNIALLLDSEYIKAIWRRGMTRYRRGKYSLAIIDLESAKCKCKEEKLQKEIDNLLELCQQKYDEIERPISSSGTAEVSMSSATLSNKSQFKDMSSKGQDKGKLSRISIIEENSSDEDAESSDDEVDVPIKILKDVKKSDGTAVDEKSSGMRRLTIIEDEEDD